MTRVEWLIVTGIIVVLALSAGWQVLQWNECRDMGFSTLYCVKHIM